MLDALNGKIVNGNLQKNAKAMLFTFQNMS
jgi:hypothetical protein